MNLFHGFCSQWRDIKPRQPIFTHLLKSTSVFSHNELAKELETGWRTVTEVIRILGMKLPLFCLELSLLTCTLLNSYLNKVKIMEKKGSRIRL